MQLDKALTRQCIGGGSLATNLLEVASAQHGTDDELDEGKLLVALAEYTHIAASKPGKIDIPEKQALAMVPSDVALSVPMLPWAIRGDVLTVLVCEPILPRVRKQIEFSLGLSLKPLLTLAPRLWQALSHHYGAPLHDRYTKILAQLDNTDAYDSRSKTITWRESLLPVSMRHPDAPPSLRFSSYQGKKERQRHDAVQRYGSVVSEGLDDAKHNAHGTGVTHEQFDEAVPSSRIAFRRDAASKLIDSAARHEDAVWVWFSFAQQFFEYTAVFAVRKDLAEGLCALGPGASSYRVRGIGVPLEMPSVLSMAAEQKQWVLRTPDADGIDGFLRRDLRRPMRSKVLTIPVLVEEKVVVLLYGDGGDCDVNIAQVADVVSLAKAVQKRLEALTITQRKVSLEGSQPPDMQTELHEPLAVDSRESTGDSSSQRAHVEACSLTSAETIADQLLGSWMGLQTPSLLDRIDKPEPSVLWPTDGSAPEKRPQVQEIYGRDDPTESIGHELGVASVAHDSKTLQRVLAHTGMHDRPALRLHEDVFARQSPLPTGGSLSFDLSFDLALQRRVNAPLTATAQHAPATASTETLTETSREDASQQHTAHTQLDQLELTAVSSHDDAIEVSVHTEAMDAALLQEFLDDHDDVIPTVDPLRPRKIGADDVATRGFDDDHLVVQQPQEPPKSQRPSDLGLPSVIVDERTELEQLFDQLQNQVASEEQAQTIVEEIEAFGTGSKDWKGLVVEKFDTFANQFGPELRWDDGGMPQFSKGKWLMRFLADWVGALTEDLLAYFDTAQPQGRKWALWLLVERGGRAAQHALMGALFDEDESVRHAGRAVLAVVVGNRGWANAVRAQLRQAARKQTDEARRIIALGAVGSIREASSVPLLLRALREGSAPVRQAASEGLREVTRRDFGEDEHAWASWWGRNASRPRYEWLLDALQAPDCRLTTNAMPKTGEADGPRALAELVMMCGQDFGYNVHDTQPERSEAVNRFRQWFEQREHASS